MRIMFRFFLPLFVQAVAVCADATSSSFRKDYYVSPKLYPEIFGPNPTKGGRAHYVIPASQKASKWPLTVTLESNGDKVKVPQTPDTKLDTSKTNWARAQHNPHTGKVWVSFHSTDDSFLNGMSKITVEDKDGATVADQGVGKPATAPVECTWVTSQKGFTQLVVHLQNTDAKAKQTISQVSVNGVAQADITLAPLGHTVLVVPVSDASLLSVWTVEYTSGGAAIGYGGTLIREFLPFLDWPKEKDCPWPEANKTTFEAFKDVGIDTHLMGKEGKCNVSYHDILKNAKKNGYWIMTQQIGEKGPQEVTTTDAVIAMMLSDEPDQDVTSKCQLEFSRQMQRSQDYPGLPTYQGGATSKFNGAFSGISDIQGVDFYAAGCAPHVTAAIAPMRIQGPYDYLLNTRNNMKPGPVWGYSQWLCSDCWDVKELQSGEITAQIASVFAASNKGLMLFQSDSNSISNPAWKDSKTMFTVFKNVREWLRVGDLFQGAVVSQQPIANETQISVIQAPDALVVILINFNASGYSDLLCAIGVGPSAHWHFKEVKSASATFRLPDGFKPGKVEESTANGLVAATITSGMDGANFKLSGINLGTVITSRVFVVHKA